MKKNKAMRLASVLLVCVLLTTSIVSGTFAKYVTSDKGGDEARVAKWGVVIAAQGTLYGEAYDSTNHTAVVRSNDNSQSVRVDAEGTDVVAPGTKSNGKGLALSVTGQPEVKTQIDATITYQNIYLKSGNWGVMVQDKTITAENFDTTNLYVKSGTSYTAAEGTFNPETANNNNYYRLHDAVNVSANYYPVVYAGAGVTGKKVTDDSLNAVAAEIGNILNGGNAVTFEKNSTTGVYTANVTNKVYDANTNLSDSFTDMNDAAISWEWKFINTKTDATGTEGQDGYVAAVLYDGEDTILGDLIAGVGDNAHVVYAATPTEGGTISYANTTTTNGVVKCGANEVGGTKTMFNITLTATQVD